MRVHHLMATLATALLAVSPVAAQTASSSSASTLDALPSVVLWAAGIAGFLGFLLGSIPPREGSKDFDFQGAVMWALATALAVGGAAHYFSTQHWTPALYLIGGGAIVALLRLSATRGPRVPRNTDLSEGVNRVQADAIAKFQAAEKLYKNASFHEGSYYASRGFKDFRFGATGIDSGTLSILSDAVASPNHSTFDILVLLVRELPGEPGEAAVIVVRGGSNLRQVQIDASGITIPAVSGKISARSIAGAVGYAWR